jgi:hypothetical protein
MTGQAADLLVELKRRGFELQARGDRLTYRPAAAMPPDLLARLRNHKPDLLRLLSEPSRDPAPDPLTAIKARWSGSTLQAVRMPRERLADLLRETRRQGNRKRAEDLRERWRERAAIMEYDGRMARPQAEALAAVDTMSIVDTTSNTG